MKGYEAARRVVKGLRELVAERSLSAKVHITEEELAEEISGDRAGFGFLVASYDIESAVVKKPDREGAEMKMWREESGGLWREGRRCGGWFGEFGRIVFIAYDFFELR